MSQLLILEGIRPDSVRSEYFGRGVDKLSDAELLEAAVEAVARPAVNEDSFSVHAPLELLARFNLLPHVDPEFGELARLQIVGLVAWYATRYERPPIPALRRLATHETSIELALRAVRTQDSWLAHDAASLICRENNVNEVLHGLADEFISRLDVSAHSHIFLRLLRDLEPQYSALGLPLLRDFLVYLARLAPVRASWPSRAQAVTTPPGPARVECDDFVKRIINPPKTARPESGGIRAIVLASESGPALSALDIADIAHDVDAGRTLAMRAACRVGPISMLTEPADHAKYGWTHCLTLPEAVWGLDSISTQRTSDTAAAVEFAVAYRSTMGTRELSIDPFAMSVLPGEQDRAEAAASVVEQLRIDPDKVRSDLISAASVRSDCHLVKYTLSALSCAERDHEATELYLSSAASLLALWKRDVPDSALGSDLARRE